MKKIFAIALSVSLFLGLSSFVVKTISESSWKSSTTETLVNERYNQTVTLYSNGYVAVQTEDGAGGGQYDITNDYIYISWENGAEQSGPVTKVTDSRGHRRIKSIIISGVTYTNTERFVVNRTRR